MIRYIFILLFLFAALMSSAMGETLNFKTFENSDIIIQYEIPLEKIVSEVASIYPAIKSDLEKKINIEISFKPVIFLVHNNSIFQKMVNGNKLVTAFAVPENNAIVIDYSKMQRTPFDLELTLKHELCHLLLHSYVQNNLLSKWLDEGISQWVSDGISDIINFDGKKLLKQAALSNHYLALRDLDTRFPQSNELFSLSYEQSRSIVEYIDSFYGKEKLLDILDMLHEGSYIEKAVFISLGVDINELEKQWHNHLKRKYTWASYLSDNIYWIIFFAGAVFTVIGFFQLKKRIREYPEDDDEFYTED